MFGTTIVLINLLIAQMSSTYDEMDEVAIDEWHYARAGLVLEFMEKTWLPPPFNLILYAWRAVRRLLRLREGQHVAKDFALFMGSAQQLQAQRVEREATLIASQKLAHDAVERTPTAAEMGKRFDAVEERLAYVLDKLDKLENRDVSSSAAGTPTTAKRRSRV